MRDRPKSLITLKKNLDASPSYHTLEYVEKKFRDRLDSFEEKITKKIQDECKAVGDSFAKSYAFAAKNNTQTTPSKENIKIAIKTARVFLWQYLLEKVYIFY